MKHYLILLLFVLIGFKIFGQSSLDLDQIKKFVRDTTSINSYKSLVEGFNETPHNLGTKEGTILYYGKLFDKNYKAYKLDFNQMEFTTLVGKGKYKKALPKGEELLKADPINLEILSALLVCYKKLDLKEKDALTKTKVDLLGSSILMYGTGKTKDNTLKVVSIGDEYAMMNMLSIEPINRNSMFTGKSTIDIWKARDGDGKRIDYYAEVLINLEAISVK